MGKAENERKRPRAVQRKSIQPIKLPSWELMVRPSRAGLKHMMNRGFLSIISIVRRLAGSRVGEGEARSRPSRGGRRSNQFYSLNILKTWNGLRALRVVRWNCIRICAIRCLFLQSNRGQGAEGALIFISIFFQNWSTQTMYLSLSVLMFSVPIVVCPGFVIVDGQAGDKISGDSLA